MSNDGISDNNKTLKKNGEMFKSLKKNNLTGKTFTLEVYSGMDDVKRSYENLAELI